MTSASSAMARPPSPPIKAPPPTAPSHVAFSTRRRRAASTSPTTRWSWLHATACSCAVVAAGAYAHAALQHYVDTSISLPTIVLPWRSLLVVTLLLVWGAALPLLRLLGVHAPLRLAGQLLTRRVPKLWALVRARKRHGVLSAASPSSRKARRAMSTDLELDENDMLVVTALSATEPRKLAARRGSSQPQHVVTSPSTVSSTSSRESSETVDADDETDAQILLHPADGAKGGRHHSNHIIVDDPYVSRFHFAIGYDSLEKEYYLQDLGSTTGTFVFLKPDVPKRLSVDDRVRLGDTEFEVVAIDTNATTGTPFLRLGFTEGPLRGVNQTLGRSPVTLGRRSGNALCITDDGSISGRHASIAYLDDGFYLTDLHSTNGTALRLSASGVPSARRYLLHGDVFGVGANRFLVEYAHELQLQEKHRMLQEEEQDALRRVAEHS